MKKLFIIVTFLLCVQSNTQEFTWNENRQLIWEDFKGEPDENSNAAAVTASGITFSYSIEKSSVHGVTGFSTKAFAYFYPKHSWHKKDVVNSHILKHEQFHFNITELNVRCFREQISKLKASSKIAKQLDALLKQANIDLEKMQRLYDAESNYSINKVEQQKWMDFVNKELKRLEKYKSK